MNLVHNECSCPVFIDIKDSIQFLVTIGISKDGLRASSGDIRLKESISATKFFCSNCDKNIDIDNINVKCSFCGQNFKSNDKNIFTLSKSGGVYCGKCSDEFFSSERKTPINKILERLILT